jgi:hypothetical protein
MEESTCLIDQDVFRFRYDSNEFIPAITLWKVELINYQQNSSDFFSASHEFHYFDAGLVVSQNNSNNFDDIPSIPQDFPIFVH